MNIRDGLPPLPERFLKLPVDPRGYPVPWFVGKVNGAWDFRVVDPAKRALAFRDRLCWLCGERLGRYMAFVIGPMCVINRNTSEPGSHLECAEFAVRACPFLMRPKAKYREANLPDGARQLPGALPGNPGAQAIYVCTTAQRYVYPGTTDWLIRLGDPTTVLWYAEGKPATRIQVLEAIQGRLHFLEDIARAEGPGALAHLEREVATTMTLLPPE